MDIKDYRFRIGDTIINSAGDKGKIVDICQCSYCEERGFYEPKWISDDGERVNYISVGDAEAGFPDYYQIGDYHFGNLDRELVTRQIETYERYLKRLHNQLASVETGKRLTRRAASGYGRKDERT